MNSLKRVSLDKKSPEEDEEAAAKVGDGALRLPPLLLFLLTLFGIFHVMCSGAAAWATQKFIDISICLTNWPTVPTQHRPSMTV